MQSERPASAPSAPKPRKGIVAAFLLACLGAFLGGTIVQEPLAAAGLAAAGFSIVVGTFVVAPLAGRHGKRNLLMAFAQPTEEDSMLIHGATGAVLSRMSAMAEDPNMQGHFSAVFDLFMKQIDLRWEMTLKNIASQRERGAGMFNPQNMGDEAHLFEDLKGQMITRFGEPVLDALGFEGASRETARAYFMLKFAGAAGGIPQGPGNGPAALPAMAGSGNPGGGWGGQ